MRNVFSLAKRSSFCTIRPTLLVKYYTTTPNKPSTRPSNIPPKPPASTPPSPPSPSPSASKPAPTKTTTPKDATPATPSPLPTSPSSAPTEIPMISGYTSIQDLKALGTLTEWGDLLTPYIITPKPYYPHIVIHYDEHSVVINDKYAKAKYHMLVMPAYEVYGFECLTVDNVPMLEEMRDCGLQLIEKIRSKEPELSFRMGFHAIPSLKQLHMHVISQDFDSPNLKNKKHWNSFNTDFFVDANLFINTLQTQGHIFLDRDFYEDIMRGPLKCNKCQEEFKTLPKLKFHANKCGMEEPMTEPSGGGNFADEPPVQQ